MNNSIALSLGNSVGDSFGKSLGNSLTEIEGGLPTPDVQFDGPWSFSLASDVQTLTGVQPDPASDWTLLLAIAPTTAATAYELLGSSDNSLNHVLVMTAGQMFLQYGGGVTGVNRAWPHSAGWVWADATYKHVGLGWNSVTNNLTMWDDGVDKGEYSLSAPVAWTADITLGCTRIVGGNRTASGWSLFDGDIKNVKYFNSLLSDETVAAYAAADV